MPDYVTCALHLELCFKPILKEKLTENVSVYSAHCTLETQALFLLNWHWWFRGTNSPRSEPKFSEWAPYLSNPQILTHINTQKCWSDSWIGCCWLCDKAGLLWEMCHPSYRGQLLHSHHSQEAHLPCSTFTAFILEAAFPWPHMVQCEKLHAAITQYCGCAGKDKPKDSQVSKI